MLEARQLAASRGDSVLFRDLDLQLAQGSLLHVRGANGSGKTTLLRALCGLVLPHAGQVLWHGRDIRVLREEYWKRLVYVGHADGLKGDLTAEENLRTACAIAGMDASFSRARAALDGFGLAGSAHLPAKSLSQGQRRRTALARLAIAEAQTLWILDEPFASLDAGAIERVRSLVGAHLSRGGMAVITTHQDARIEAQSMTELDLAAR